MLERARLLVEAIGGGPTGLAVPLVRQTTSYSCGAASLLAVIRYWRGDSFAVASDRALLGPLKTTAKSGTDASRIASVARAHGLRAQLLHGAGLEDVRRRLRAGQTVIVDFQAWPQGQRGEAQLDDGHFAVLVGLDGSRAYLMDPWITNRYGHISISELLRTWMDNERNKQLAIAIWSDGPKRTKQLGTTRRIETRSHIK